MYVFQSLVEASSKRVVHLASQWEKHRAPLIDEHRRLKELCSNREVQPVYIYHSFFNILLLLCYFKKHVTEILITVIGLDWSFFKKYEIYVPIFFSYP